MELSMLKEMMVDGVSLLRACGPYVLILMAILVVGFMVYFYIPYWRVRRVPGPPATFLVGHLPLLAQYGTDIFRALAQNYGPIYRFHMGRQPLVIVADAELCREVGIKKFKHIKNRSSPTPTSGSPLHQEGLFLSRDSRWSSMRNTIISLYQPTRISSLVPTMQSHIDSLFLNVAKTEEGADIPFYELSLKMAIDVIGDTAFGVQFGLSKQIPQPIPDGKLEGGVEDQEVSSRFLKQHMHSIEALKMDLSGSFSTILGLVVPVLQKPCREVLKRIPGTADYKLYHTNEKLCERIDAVIAKRSSERAYGDSRDFLAAVLNARDSGVAKDLFTQNYIRALTYEHLLAGTKTSAFTLAMTVYLVSKHPEVEKKLLQEIDSFGSGGHRIPTAEDLQCGFPYLDQVVKETMRFCTVSPLVARETSEEVEIGGYNLPKGTWVWLALGVLAKDPKQFPEPDTFRPERFNPDGEEDKRRHPYAHIPFGIGPRECIGKRFAIQEIKLALIRLYQAYVFRHSPKMESPLELEYGLVLGFKNGIKLRAIKRRS